MDKQAYYLNKKKQPAKTEGKFLYYYPCADKNLAETQIGKKYYVVVEVTEAEWESLTELDRLEYNNEHIATRHKSEPLFENEDNLKSEEQEQQIDGSVPFVITSNEPLYVIKTGIKRYTAEKLTLLSCVP